MMELILIAMLEAKYQMEQDERFQEQLRNATPAERKVLLERREKEKQEREIERRHREQIRAQERIAEAIRFAAIMNS